MTETATEKDTKRDFHRIVELYLDKVQVKTAQEMYELEVRFGKNNWTGKNLSRIDYDNVVNAIKTNGFNSSYPDGTNHLRVNTEYIDSATGLRKISNIRADIVGTDLIQNYCKTNSIQALIDLPATRSAFQEKIKFTQKVSVMDHYSLKPAQMIHFHDHNFRVDLKEERDFSMHSKTAQKIIGTWLDSKKQFRHLNRVRFAHPKIPVLVDMSIVRSSGTVKGVPIPRYTVQEAGLFTNPVSYEIELELDSSRVSNISVEQALDHLRKCIRIVLGAIQDSQYPIPNSECEAAAKEYMRIIHGDKYEPRKNGRVLPYDFTGPSSVTLQLENITVPDGKSLYPNIREGYSVTEKADGERKLMFINSTGRIYFINSGMNISFTGAITTDKTLFGSILDGEHIKHNRSGRFINLYAAFDVYYIHGKSVRNLAFIKTDETDVDSNYRLPILNTCIEMLKPKSVTGSAIPVRVECKEFYYSSSIFDSCNRVLSRAADGLYEYETDGLIFTPIDLGVGGDVPGQTGMPVSKHTWLRSFKWKPPQFNTVDFLVSAKLDKSGNPEIHTRIQPGNREVLQYKTYTLNCGFNRKVDGYIQPMQDMFDGKTGPRSMTEGEPEDNAYFPTRFVPTDPYDVTAGTCNIVAENTNDGRLITRTENNETFSEDMIVEFRYDREREAGWRWVPLRVRYDKTTELLNGNAEYGNAYRTANSNWRSIHYPVTEDMIVTGEKIPEIMENDEVYYNDRQSSSEPRAGMTAMDTETQGLRDFHNRYVKRSLILSVCNRQNTLIDFAVGRAGDLPKWKDAQLRFVFGVDVARENIENRKSGACARYLDMCRTNSDMPAALFLRGNSGLNLRDGSAFVTDKEKMVAKAVFGTGPKDRSLLGEGVYKNYGQGKEGFNVASVQFALHYFFENQMTLHSFLRNVTECTKVGGYFIGTCYDGKTVFDILKTRSRTDPLMISKNGKKIFEMTRKYEETGFPDDEQSLGYAIDVFQESINKTFQEYLVNFDFLIRMMENYGFALVKKDEAQKLGLPNGTGMFRDMYTSMMEEIRRHPSAADNYRFADKMTEEEKRISYMNRYFVFRKVAQIPHPEKMMKYIEIPGKVQDEDEEEEDADDIAAIVKGVNTLKVNEKEEHPATESDTAKHFIRRIRSHKLVIQDYDPVEMGVDDEAAQLAKELDAITVGVGKLDIPSRV